VGVATGSEVAGLPAHEARRLAPDEIPQQVLVSMFFLQVAAFSSQIDERRYHLLLKDLGIPPGSVGDRALSEAARSAMKVIDWPEVDAALKGPAADAFHATAMLNKAEALAEIYANLLVRLASIEGAPERVAGHVERKRHTVVSTWIGDFTPAELASEGAFRARVRALIDERLPERLQP
jgi:hypothetical protein